MNHSSDEDEGAVERFKAGLSPALRSALAGKQKKRTASPHLNPDKSRLEAFDDPATAPSPAATGTGAASASSQDLAGDRGAGGPEGAGTGGATIPPKSPGAETGAVPQPKPQTAAQVMASRANGAKGGGPVTPKGKSVSRTNALKRGLNASTLRVVSSTARACDEFGAVVAELTDTIGTSTVPQFLIDAAANAIVRYRRANRHYRDVIPKASNEVAAAEEALSQQLAILDLLRRLQELADAADQEVPQMTVVPSQLATLVQSISEALAELQKAAGAEKPVPAFVAVYEIIDARQFGFNDPAVLTDILSGVKTISPEAQKAWSMLLQVSVAYTSRRVAEAAQDVQAARSKDQLRVEEAFGTKLKEIERATKHETRAAGAAFRALRRCYEMKRLGQPAPHCPRWSPSAQGAG